MNIAYVSGDRGIPVDGTKGASIHVRGVSQALARRGHQVRLLSLRNATAPAGFRPGLIGCGFDPLLKELRDEVRRADGGVLAGELYSLLLNGNLRHELESLDRRWPVDAVYERFSLWSWAGLHFARERRIPLVLEVNAPLVEEQKTWRGLALQPVAAALERMVIRGADAVTVPSESLRAYLRASVGRRRGVHVVPNGTDLALFAEPRHAPPARIALRLRGRFVVAFVGSLKQWHGIEPLWRAFRALCRRLPQAHLLVIGDGPMRPYLEAAARDGYADAVTMMGAVDHEQVAPLLALAHVGVAPYPRLDPFYFCPLKIIEYMAAGLPTVASRIGDIPRLVAHDRNGLLVPPGDTRALSSALRQLAEDHRLRSRLGRRARERAHRRFGWDAAADRIEKLLRSARVRLQAGTGPRAAAGGGQ